MTPDAPSSAAPAGPADSAVGALRAGVPADVAACLAGAREATGRLLGLVARTPDLAAPSLLPGWSRAHVVAHLAGNARSHVRMLAGLEQYEGGAEGREAGVEALAADPRAAVRALHDSVEELETAWRRADWTAEVRPLARPPGPAAALAWARWREVEVHAVDLAAGYRPADWPRPFLDRLLAELRGWPELPDVDDVRGPDAEVAAWLIGRSDGSGLEGRLPPVPPWR